MKRLRTLEEENRQLKRLVADQVLNLQVVASATTDAITKLTYWQTVSYELFHKTDSSKSVFQNLLDDIYHLATGTTGLDDTLEKLLSRSGDTAAIVAEKTKQQAEKVKAQARELADFYNKTINSIASRNQQDEFTLAGDSLGASRAALAKQAEAEEDTINAKYKTGIALTADQVTQRVKLLANLNDEVALRDKIIIQTESQKAAEATSKVVQSGVSAQSDLDSAGARLAAAQIKNARDAEEEVRKQHVETSVAEEAQRRKDLRAERDYYADVTKAARESEQQIPAARSDIDPDATDAAARRAIWNNYYDNLGKLGVNQVDLAGVTSAQIARLDRDRASAAVSEMKGQLAAYENYGGIVGKVAKTAGLAIREFQIGAQVSKDGTSAASEAAASIASAAAFDPVGAALHAKASTALTAAAIFGAGQMLGTAASAFGGGSGGSGGGGGGGSGSSTFTRTTKTPAAATRRSSSRPSIPTTAASSAPPSTISIRAKC